MPTIERFEPRELGFKPWGSELLIAWTDTYIGKILTMKAGHRGGLQYHEVKDETFHLVSGRCLVRHDPGDGRLAVLEMRPGQSFHIPPGTVHQVEAVEDCVFFEASTPHFDDRVNVSERYDAGQSGESA